MSTTDSGVTLDRPLRADAARNRELILQTARRCFAERGLGVTLNDIAHEAGVGVGTVYRRFADKDELIEALLVAKFEALTAAAELAAAVPDPAEALRVYLMGVFEYRARDRALAEVIVRAATARPSIVQERERLERLVDGIVARAEQTGTVRAGFSARDVPLLTVMLGAVADRTRACDPDAWRRYADLLIEGIVPSGAPIAAEMTGAPLDRDAIDRAMHPPA